MAADVLFAMATASLTLRKQFLFIALLVSALAACKKHDDTPIGVSVVPNDYLQLTPGNYWIYETFYVDSNGNGAPGSEGGNPPLYDSVYVASDTVRNGVGYHRLMKPNEAGSKAYNTFCLRDSLDYSVEPSGRVELALNNVGLIFFSRTYQSPQFSDDSVVTVTWKREEAVPKTVPVGTFNTIAMAYTWTYHPFATSGRSVSSRKQYFRYAKGIGLISETMGVFVSDPKYVERRLVRYHVQ